MRRTARVLSAAALAGAVAGLPATAAFADPASQVSPGTAMPGGSVTVSVTCESVGGEAPASIDATSQAFDQGSAQLRRVEGGGERTAGAGVTYRGTARIASAADLTGGGSGVQPPDGAGSGAVPPGGAGSGAVPPGGAGSDGLVPDAVTQGAGGSGAGGSDTLPPGAAGSEAAVPDSVPPDGAGPDAGGTDAKAPATAARDSAASDAAAPDAAVPDGAGSDAAAPDPLAPDALGPDTVPTDTVPPDAAAPDAAVPDAAAPDAAAPHAVPPNGLAPNTLSPNPQSPDAAAPDAAAPDSAPPGAVTPDSAWTVNGTCPGRGGKPGAAWSATFKVDLSGRGGRPCGEKQRTDDCATAPVQRGVEAGEGGTFTDSVPALVAGGVLIAGALGAAAHRLRRRDSTAGR